MEVATQQGAEPSIENRIDAYLAAEEAPKEEELQGVDDALPEVESTEEIVEAEAEVSEEEDVSTDVEAAEETETEVEATDETATDATDDVKEYELSDVSSLLGVDESLFTVSEEGNLLLNTKIDGQPGTITLQDAIKSYQLEGHLNNKSMEVSEQRKALENETSEFKEQSQAKLQQLDTALKLAFSDLYQEFEAINWNELSQTNPSEYSALRLKYQDREARLNHSLSALDQEKTVQQQQQAEQLAKVRENNLNELLAKIPEWTDQKAFEEGRATMKKSLTDNYGFTPDEVSNVIDHRFLLMARDAQKYRELQDKKETVIKKVKVAPKTAKSGASKTKTTTQTKLEKTRARIKQSGGRDGVTDYLAQRGII